MGKDEIKIIEQITKADRNARHAFCGKAKPAPHFGGLVPPLCVREDIGNAKRKI